MTRPIRIAIHLQTVHAEFDDIRRAVIRAEEMGVDMIFNWDHFYPFFGDHIGKSFESWTTLATWAEVTERVEIGTLVTSVGYRNPQLLADMARTIDHASGGRLILGLGSGALEKDYTEYGYEFGSAGSRLDDLGSGLRQINERFAQLEPPPTRKIPLLIGGGGEKKTLRYAAAFADIWHGYGPPHVISRKNDILDKHCLAFGRDPTEIERSVGAQPDAPDSAEKFVAAGASLFTLAFDGTTGYDLAPVAAWLAWRDEQNAMMGAETLT